MNYSSESSCERVDLKEKIRLKLPSQKSVVYESPDDICVNTGYLDDLDNEFITCTPSPRLDEG